MSLLTRLLLSSGPCSHPSTLSFGSSSYAVPHRAKRLTTDLPPPPLVTAATWLRLLPPRPRLPRLLPLPLLATAAKLRNTLPMLPPPKLLPLQLVPAAGNLPSLSPLFGLTDAGSTPPDPEPLHLPRPDLDPPSRRPRQSVCLILPAPLILILSLES